MANSGLRRRPRMARRKSSVEAVMAAWTGGSGEGLSGPLEAAVPSALEVHADADRYARGLRSVARAWRIRTGNHSHQPPPTTRGRHNCHPGDGGRFNAV